MARSPGRYSVELCAAIEAALAVATATATDNTLVAALLEQAYAAARCNASPMEKLFRR